MKETGISRDLYKKIEEGKASLASLSAEQFRMLEKVLHIQRGRLTWTVTEKEPPVKVTRMSREEIEDMLKKEYGEKWKYIGSQYNFLRRNNSIMSENWQGKGRDTTYKRREKKEGT